MSILVVGASGKLGGKIVHELRALGAAVRVTHRASSKPEALEGLRAAGAELVVADLADEASLDRACAGMRVVVSAVQGLRDVIVDGQTRLLRAAERAGVARIIPSDYSLDFFKTTPGGNRNLDLRREFNAVVDGSKVRGASVLNGAFMDLIAYGMIGPGPDGVFKVWGDADQPYDFTHTDDVAKFIADVALDPDAPRHTRVSGHTCSPRELAAMFVAARGKPVELQAAGSIAELDALIARMRAADPAEGNTFPVWQQLQYMRDMASGQGRLAPLANARYPAIHPRTIPAILRG